MENTLMEYKEISAHAGQISLLIDGYESFGWSMLEQTEYTERSKNGQIKRKEKIRFERSRVIVNRNELLRLERYFEACLREIDQMEKNKKNKGQMIAGITAAIGTGFMAGSVMAIAANPPQIAISVGLSILAVIGWILPYFLYKHYEILENKRLNPMINEKYDEVFRIMEKGKRLSGD